MNKEHTDKLFSDFSDLFKNADNLRVSLMSFGFECYDGWFDLLYDTFSSIQYALFHTYGCIPDDFYIVQVKEKWGGLRIYTSYMPECISGVIDEAEHRSFETCEMCGKVGKHFLRDLLPYVRTLCDNCLDDYVMKKFGRKRRDCESFVSDYRKKHFRCEG